VKPVSKKGIVLGLEGRKMIIVTEEGDFLSLPVASPPPGLGETIKLPDFQSPGWLRSRWLIAAAAVLLLFLSFSLVRPFLLPQAVAAVSFDLSSGLEIQVDEQNRITQVKALQPEGEKLVSQLHLQGESIYTAVGDVIATARGQGCLPTGEEAAVLVTVIPLQAKDRPGPDPHRLQQEMAAGLERHGFQGYLLVQRAEKDCRREAGKMGLSVGRYLLGEKARAGGKAIYLEDLRAKPVMKLLEGSEENLETMFPGMWCRLGKGHGPQKGISAGGGRRGSGLEQELSPAGSGSMVPDLSCPMPAAPFARQRGGR
jgi:hypothetical protein